MNVNFNIQSFSDVITNSSNEIFTTFDNEAMVNTIKSIVNSLLSLGISNYTFDDLFTIDIHWCYSNRYKEYGYKTEKEFIEFLKEHDGWTSDSYDYGVDCTYEVKAKPEAEDLLGVKETAELLNKIQKLFNSQEYYS